MELQEALFSQTDVSIYQVHREQDLVVDFRRWSVSPIHAATLAANSVPDGILDGHFILKAVFALPGGEILDGYVDAVLPERISETAYLIEDGHIRQKTYRDFPRIWGVPLVAIEGFGNYELFYSRINPEIGLEVLRKGLAIAKDKENIALDIGYILRDEQRYQESLEAFTVAIDAGEAAGHGNRQYFQYYYAERDALLKKLAAADEPKPNVSE